MGYSLISASTYMFYMQGHPRRPLSMCKMPDSFLFGMPQPIPCIVNLLVLLINPLIEIVKNVLKIEGY